MKSVEVCIYDGIVKYSKYYDKFYSNCVCDIYGICVK